MKVVIFAGGLSSRLWPVARRGVPKAFHKILNNKTPFEDSYAGIRKIFNPEDIYVSAGIKDRDHIKELAPEIPEGNFILETRVVDTGPAVAYAMLRIQQKFPKEPVLIRWANSTIKDIQAFKDVITEANNFFSDEYTDLIFVGVPLLYPNPNIGHIKCLRPKTTLKGNLEVYNFGGFVEKPDLPLAKRYFKSDSFVGNPGIYITRPDYLLEQLERIDPKLYGIFERMKAAFGTDREEEVIKREFAKIDRISADYLFWENIDLSNIKVIVGEFGWRYISAWGQLKRALENNSDDNICKGSVKLIKSKNNLVYNLSESKIVATAGVEGLVIINTEDALLVTTVEDSALVRDLKKELEEDGKYKQFV